MVSDDINALWISGETIRFILYSNNALKSYGGFHIRNNQPLSNHTIDGNIKHQKSGRIRADLDESGRIRTD